MPRSVREHAQTLARARLQNGETNSLIETHVMPDGSAIVCGTNDAEIARRHVLEVAVRSGYVTKKRPTDYPVSKASWERGRWEKDPDPSLERWQPGEEGDAPSTLDGAVVWRSPTPMREIVPPRGSHVRAIDTSRAIADASGAIFTDMTGRLTICLRRTKQTLADVALRSGVQEGTLNSISAGESLPSRAQLDAIAAACDTTPEWLGGRVMDEEHEASLPDAEEDFPAGWEHPWMAGIKTPSTVVPDVCAPLVVSVLASTAAKTKRAGHAAAQVLNGQQPDGYSGAELRAAVSEACEAIGVSPSVVNAPDIVSHFDVFDRMKMARIAAGMTTGEIAGDLSEEAGYRVASAEVEQYESGGGTMALPLPLLRAWSASCGTSWEWILTGRVPKNVRRERLAAARRISKMSQKAMAERVWGQSSLHRHISLVEIGDEPLSVDEESLWMRACGLQPEWLSASDDEWDFRVRGAHADI